MTTMRNTGRVGDFLRDLRRRLAQEAQQGARTFVNKVPCGEAKYCWIDGEGTNANGRRLLKESGVQ